jgi:hypothetical protein
MEIDFPGGGNVDESFELIGEGAYEGLTAVAKIGFGEACPNMRGYVIHGSVPAPPTADTADNATAETMYPGPAGRPSASGQSLEVSKAKNWGFEHQRRQPTTLSKSAKVRSPEARQVP